MRTGVFGGSFDPPHVGHAIVARYALERLELERVLFVPAARPPHKRDRAQAPAALRLEMTRAAVADTTEFEVDSLELDRAGPSFTVDTIEALTARRPADELVLLLGTDQFREFHTWRRPGDIVRHARVAVLARGEDGVDGPAAALPHEVVDVPRIDVSSTEIRERVADGRPIRYLVADSVLAIIEREHLYLARDREVPVARGDEGSC